MNGAFVDTLFFPALFYFLIFLFNNKTFKWRYLIHTFFAISIMSFYLWHDYAVGNWLYSEYVFDFYGFISTIILSVLLVVIITQNNKKSYADILHQEIWGEWARFNNKD